MSSTTDRQKDEQGVQAAAAVAERCRSLLKERCSGDQITVEMTVWDIGAFSVTAFHTVRSGVEDTSFTREVVTYTAGNHPDAVTGTFVHAVRHYYSGHHEEWYEYPLGAIDGGDW